MFRSRVSKIVYAAICLAAVGALFALGGSISAGPSAARSGSYPYSSRAFSRFVTESYMANYAGNPDAFYTWMNKAYASSKYKYPGKENMALLQALASRKVDLESIKKSSARAKAEIDTAAWAHRMIKKAIPRFSLDRGFEFSNVVSFGERQCFLQSVLIAGLLQQAGIDAGVVMVYKNTAGEETNNGHAVTLVKLSDGRDVIVDASEQEPFARQQGLFVQAREYRYVDPVYKKGSYLIEGYRLAGGGDRIYPSQVCGMDTEFLRSQFWYYRGERAAGGILSTIKTGEGIKESREALSQSVKICPKNPLSVYMLGRAYMAEGKRALARKTLLHAHSVYRRAGWLPDGPREVLRRL
jgi:hypothetical protein